jgi:hypothetical protein
MPKRIVDGEGIWKSDKIAAVEPARFRGEYANLLPLALANGSFECNARAVWATVYSYNRPDVTPEDVSAILGEFERVKLLYRWTVSGKTWGFWVGIDKPGRLPSEARLNGRHDRRGEEVPKDKLREFLGYSIENKTEANGMPSVSQEETTGAPIGSLGLGLGLGKGLGKGNGMGLGSGSGEGSGEGNTVTKALRERNENQNPPESQNLSLKRKTELQEQLQKQKLLTSAIEVYREQHGREPDDRAFGIICSKNHIPFDLGKTLLLESVVRVNHG